MMKLGVALGIVVASGQALLCVQCGPKAGTSQVGARAPARPPASVVPAASPGGEVRADAGADAGAPGWSAPAITAIEQEFIDLINRERTSRGLAALVPDGRLTEAARGHSREMGEMGYFDHRSPTAGLHTPGDRFLRVLGDRGMGAPAEWLLGENIYHISEFDHFFNVEFGHRAIMKSPSHRAAILEPRYTKVGVGVYQDARGELWATELFLREAPWLDEEL